MSDLKSAITVVQNSAPKKGRISSIVQGLKRTEGNFPVFIQDVDMPFVGTHLLNRLYQNSTEDGYTSPMYKGMSGHPILISPYAVREIAGSIRHFENLKEALATYPRTKVDVEDAGILMNINSPQDYFEQFGTCVPNRESLSPQ